MPWLDQLLTVGVAATRFAFAFIFVPVFSREVMPTTVRNSIIVTFGLVALAVQPKLRAGQFDRDGLAEDAAEGSRRRRGDRFLLRHGDVGFVRRGRDHRHQGGRDDRPARRSAERDTTSLTGILLARFAEVVFVSAGGLTLLVGTVMGSYMIWPLGPGGLTIDMRALQFFEGEFGRLFALAFIFSAPVLTVLYVIDAGLGFLNRFAQSFNVFSMSMPIKAAAATFVVILTLPLLAQAVLAEIGTRAEIAMAACSSARAQPRSERAFSRHARSRAWPREGVKPMPRSSRGSSKCCAKSESRREAHVREHRDRRVQRHRLARAAAPSRGAADADAQRGGGAALPRLGARQWRYRRPCST
jgi:type III secretion protein T